MYVYVYAQYKNLFSFIDIGPELRKYGNLKHISLKTFTDFFSKL